MANDEALIDRLRGIAPIDTAEKTVFGARCWVLDGNMAFGVHGDRMLVRLGPGPGDVSMLEPFDPIGKGKPMAGWFLVDQDHLATERDLRAWMERAIEFALTLPSK